MLVLRYLRLKARRFKDKLNFQPVTNSDEEALKTAPASTKPIAMYLMADTYDVTGLREDVIERFWCAVQAKRIDLQISLLACVHLPSHSAFYKLALDVLMQKFAIQTVRCAFDRLLCQQLPSEVWLRIFAAATGGQARPMVKRTCTYHELGSDQAKKDECVRNRAEREAACKLEYTMPSNSKRTDTSLSLSVSEGLERSQSLGANVCLTRLPGVAYCH
jgi:hypothetical protein